MYLYASTHHSDRQPKVYTGKQGKRQAHIVVREGFITWQQCTDTEVDGTAVGHGVRLCACMSVCVCVCQCVCVCVCVCVFVWMRVDSHRLLRSRCHGAHAAHKSVPQQCGWPWCRTRDGPVTIGEYREEGALTPCPSHCSRPTSQCPG